MQRKKLRHIYVPIEAILAIYAKENGRGMIFEEEPEESEPPPATEQPPKRAKPNLKVVK